MTSLRSYNKYLTEILNLKGIPPDVLVEKKSWRRGALCHVTINMTDQGERNLIIDPKAPAGLGNGGAGEFDEQQFFDRVYMDAHNHYMEISPVYTDRERAEAYEDFLEQRKAEPLKADDFQYSGSYNPDAWIYIKFVEHPFYQFVTQGDGLDNTQLPRWIKDSANGAISDELVSLVWDNPRTGTKFDPDPYQMAKLMIRAMTKDPLFAYQYAYVVNDDLGSILNGTSSRDRSAFDAMMNRLPTEKQNEILTDGYKGDIDESFLATHFTPADMDVWHPLLENYLRNQTTYFKDWEDHLGGELEEIYDKVKEEEARHGADSDIFGWERQKEEDLANAAREYAEEVMAETEIPEEFTSQADHGIEQAFEVSLFPIHMFRQQKFSPKVTLGVFSVVTQILLEHAKDFKGDLYWFYGSDPGLHKFYQTLLKSKQVRKELEKAKYVVFDNSGRTAIFVVRKDKAEALDEIL